MMFGMHIRKMNNVGGSVCPDVINNVVTDDNIAAMWLNIYAKLLHSNINTSYMY